MRTLKTMKKIFISHSVRDLALLQTMRDNLVQIGYKPWIDPNPRPGQDWRYEIDDAIRAADAVMVILTPHAAQSVYVTYEWTWAIAHHVPVIVVMFRATDIHPRLQTLHFFDATEWRDMDQFWNHFRHEVQQLLENPSQLSSQAAPASSSAQSPRRAIATAPLIDRDIMPEQAGHWLVVRRGPEPNSMFLLDKPVLTLGRDENNDIAIADPEISRYHLRFRRQPNNMYTIEDLGSTNGTLIDGKRLNGVVPLVPGKAIMLGDTVIVTYELVK